MSLKERFEITPGFRKWSLGLIGIGVLSLIIGYIVYGTGDASHQAYFWGALLHNSIYFLLVTNAVMFFFCATTLSLAGFQISFKRVTEAISACVPVIGAITFIVMLFIVFGHKDMVYEWLNKADVSGDHVLAGKKGFLNPGFFLTWTVLAIAWPTALATVSIWPSTSPALICSRSERRKSCWRATRTKSESVWR